MLLTTTYPNKTENRNINEGRAYKNNLMIDPFNFPKEAECHRTHQEQIREEDVTCIYDLTQPWVGEFISRKC